MDGRWRPGQQSGWTGMPVEVIPGREGMVREMAEEKCNYRWLGYELHDGLVQWMVSARMTVDVVLAESNGLSATSVARLKQVRNILDSGLEEGRDLIAFLESADTRPSIDVCESLRDFIERVEHEAEAAQQKLVGECPDPDWPRMPPDRAWNLVRIVQQAIRNALQHAGPATVRIRLGWDSPDRLCVDVADDGRGFDPSQVDPSSHFGLSGMQHRARLLGGELSIESKPGQGTRVRLIVPREKVACTDE
ncbi:MAG: sensor histidine kinase [Planctomycetota bacterium]|nr:MAG: sensor histidine kinase [Planctomycetota bacterium]